MCCFIVTCFLLFQTEALFSADERIKILVDTDNAIGEINPRVFGTHVLGYDPSTIYKGKRLWTGYSNYGAGIWDPGAMQPVPEVITLLNDIGIRTIRFPGGTGASFYDWKKTIGPPSSRKNFLFGLDEFIQTSKKLNSEVIYVLPYHSGTSQDAADLVEYLNALNDGQNPGGGVDWASKRAKNGHPEPYGVNYFELGNEVNFGLKRMGIADVEPDTYAMNYLEYREKMRNIDPSIQLGAVTVNSGSVLGISAWNDKVFQLAGNNIDFLVDHTLRPAGSGYSSSQEGVDKDEIFALTIKSLEKVDAFYKDLSNHFEQITGRKRIPIAVTEYGTLFDQDKPIPFRHSLGTALFNAGLIQFFLKPENNIIAATNLQSTNSYYGMIRNDNYMKLTGHYVKRPNFYVFEMFAKHFGPRLIEVQEKDSADLMVKYENINLLENVVWSLSFFSGAKISEINGVVEINVTKNKNISFSHVRKKVKVEPNTTYYLSGYLKAENLQDNEGFCLEIQDIRKSDNIHSIMSTKRVWGTTDWVYVEAFYTTMADASDINVIVRRHNRHGQTKGNVFVKKVELKKVLEGLKNNGSLSISASTDENKKKLYVMVFNRNVSKAIEADIQIKGHILSRQGVAWDLNGPNVWSTNENKSENVKINKKDLQITDSHEFDYTFPAHSLTSLEFGLN